MRINVRCCCNPSLVYGTLPWDGRSWKVRFVEMIPYQPPSANSKFESPIYELEVDTLIEGGVKEFAYKSNDYPIELFRKLQGFIEGDRVYGVYY